MKFKIDEKIITEEILKWKRIGVALIGNILDQKIDGKICDMM